MELRTRHLGGFGKLASQGDFVTFGTRSDPALRFQDYLFEAVEHAYEVEPSWRQTAASDRAFAFIYRTSSDAPGEGLVVGVLRGSRDTTGRVFPFALYAVLDAAGLPEESHILPLGLGAFLEQASVALDDAIDGRTTSDPSRDLPAPSADQLRAALTDYAVWTTSRTVEDVALTLFGRKPREGLARALGTVREILLPLSGLEPPRTRLAARLPLGAAGSGGVSFWWDAARRLGNWQRNVPSLFWEGGVPEPQVLMHFGDVAPRALAELWVPNRNSALVGDLSAPSDAETERSGRPGVQPGDHDPIVALLEHPAMPVSEFLGAL